MAYKTEQLFEQAKEVIVKHKLFFIEDIVSFLPCDKTTFYNHFKVDSNDFNELKELLEVNRVELKVSMRSKWYKSNAPALQMALMKLICTDDERRILSMQYNENNSNLRVQVGEFEDWSEQKLEEELERLRSGK